MIVSTIKIGLIKSENRKQKLLLCTKMYKMYKNQAPMFERNFSNNRKYKVGTTKPKHKQFERLTNFSTAPSFVSPKWILIVYIDHKSYIATMKVT